MFQFSFSLLLHITETFGLMEQLANLAMRQWESILFLLFIYFIVCYTVVVP